MNDLDVEKWCGGDVHFVRDDILHLMRGQVYTIGNKTFFTFGGAHSKDWMWRTEGKSWWKAEIPTEKEMNTGRINLQKHQNIVDYMITHTAPYEILVKLGIDIADEEYDFASYLEELRKTIGFNKWYFGHLHLDEDIDN